MKICHIGPQMLIEFVEQIFTFFLNDLLLASEAHGLFYLNMLFLFYLLHHLVLELLRNNGIYLARDDLVDCISLCLDSFLLVQ